MENINDTVVEAIDQIEELESKTAPSGAAALLDNSIKRAEVTHNG